MKSRTLKGGLRNWGHVEVLNLKLGEKSRGPGDWLSERGEGTLH